MATTDVQVLQLSTGVSVKNINELRQYIKALKEDLQDENATVEQNAATTEELRAAQGALRDAMYATTKTAEEYKAQVDAIIGAEGDLVKNIEGQTASYNDLVHILADLKSAWRATTDEAERAVLTEQIDKVNSKLKEMDASVGTFSRNVGNYTNRVSDWGKKMSSGFTATAGSAKALIAPVASVTAGLKAMSATPVVAVLGLIANALTRVTQGLKSSETNLNSMNRALAAFQPIADAFQRGIQAIGNGLATMSNKVVDLLDKYGLLSDASRERIRLAENEANLTKIRRKNLVDEANLEASAANLREKANDKEKYTLEQRKKYWEDYELTTRAIYKNRKAIADEELRQAQAEAKLTDNDAATNDRIAQLEVSAINAQRDLSNAMRTMRRERDRIFKEEQAAARQAAQDAKREAKERQQAAAAELAAERDLLLAEAELLAEGSEQRLAKMKEARRAEYDIAVESAKEKITNEETLQRTLTMLEEKYNRDIEKLEADHARALAAQQVAAWKNWAELLKSGLTAEMDTRREAQADIIRDAVQAERDRQRALLDEMEAGAEELASEGAEAVAGMYAARIAAAEEGSAEYLTAVVGLRKAELDAVRQLDGESDDIFAARLEKARDALTAAEHELSAAAIAAGRSVLEASADTFAQGSIERLQAMVDVAAYDFENLTRRVGETIDDFEERRARASAAMTEAVRALAAEEMRMYRERIDAAADGSAEYLTAMVVLRKKELDTLARLDGESATAFEERVIAARTAVLAAEQDLEQYTIAAGRQVLQNAADSLVTGTREQLEALVEVAAYDFDNLTQQIGETAEQFEARRIAAANTLHDAIRAVEDKSAEEDRLWWENRMNEYQEGSLAYLSAAVDLKRYELDTLHQLEEESDEEFRARQLEAERAHLDAISELWDARLNVGYAYAGAISSLLANLADIYEEDSENNEKAVQQVKNLRIASAIIDTISGAVAAYMNGIKTIPIPSWAGIALGAVQAATVVAAGMAQVAKIRNTQVSRSSSGSASVDASVPSAATPPPSVPKTAQETAVIQNAYNTQQLNTRKPNLRVYILQSDLEASGTQVQVRESETTF